MRTLAPIVLYYLCGVMAAAQLGKLAALAPVMSRDLHLGLAATAALTSMLEISGALLGGVAGRQLPRLGLRRALVAAMTCLALGAAVAALAQGAWVVALARLVESVGYLVTVVAAPVLIAQLAPPHRQAAAMTLWSTFVPVGMAVGAWSYAQLAGVSNWRLAQGLSVVAGLVLAAGLLRLHRRAPRPTASVPTTISNSVRLSPVLKMLTAAFGVYAIMEVGLLALLPSLLAQAGVPLADAGALTALAALANVPASAMSAWLMRRRRSLAWPLVGSLVTAGLLCPLAYGLGAGLGTAPAVQAGAAILVNLTSGVFASLVFALLPRAATGEAQLSAASGRLTQFGASGALLGPPLMGSLVEHWGWPSAGIASLALAAMSAGLALWVCRSSTLGHADKTDGPGRDRRTEPAARASPMSTH